jgi:hypothetical protein
MFPTRAPEKRREEGHQASVFVGRINGGGVEFTDLKPLIALEIAFAVKPVLHGRLQAVEGYARPGFEQSISGGKCVVKDGVVGEVTHGEVVDPVDGAVVAAACGVDSLD